MSYLPIPTVWLCALSILVVPLPLAASEPDPAQGVAYFEKHVRPLLVRRCYACHSEGAGEREGGLLLDSRTGWAEGGERGPSIVPGDVAGSLLIQAVRYDHSDLRMPPDRRLSPREISLLEQWVKIGAPDPRERVASGPAADSDRTDPSDPVAGRDHWSFRPLRQTRVPAVQATDWPRVPLDHFVLSRLESAGLRPAAEAERRVLIRRLSFQLLGLPPTPEQVEAFLRDQQPGAWERLVDRLLASPQFGERWGRHWLDLARYADSNGLDENFLFREAWRYRNWVLDAVGRDLPFDRFLLEQVAGDLLPWETLAQRDSQRIAAGFLVVGPKVLLGNDPENQKMEVADEQLDTIGRAVLGQTLGCARCHDHKFDPVPTADYYALAGIFTSTQVMEQRYMLGEQRVMERLAGLGSDGEALDAAYEAYWRQRPGKVQAQKDAQAALKLLEQEDADADAASDAWEKFAREHPAAVAEGAADAGVPRQRRLELQRAKVAELDAWIANPPPIPPRAMSPEDRPAPADEFIRIAGQFDRKGEQVPRGFLQVLSGHEPVTGGDGPVTGGDGPVTGGDGPVSGGDEPVSGADERAGFEGSGRIELARWLVDTRQGAGRLTARVLANRVWQHLLGRGLVRTVDNFGRTGEPPTHPELLDHLADELVASGWSLKSLVRTIVLSRTFRMSSQHDAAAHDIDPDNRLLWRANRRRLDPEAMRDAMLWAAGQLDPRPMDSTVWYLGDQATAVGGNENRRRTDFPCRSVYLPVIRNDLPEIFEVFDFANPHVATGQRPQTTVATQGLFLLNSTLVMDCATATAQRELAQRELAQRELAVSGQPIQPAQPSQASQPSQAGQPGQPGPAGGTVGDAASPEEETLARMFQRISGAPPTAEEQAALLTFVEQTRRQFEADGQPDAELRTWAMVAQALFASSRFQILE